MEIHCRCLKIANKSRGVTFYAAPCIYNADAFIHELIALPKRKRVVKLSQKDHALPCFHQNF